MKQPRKMSQNSLNNLQKADNFSKENQPSPEAKSKGQIGLSIKKNLIETLRTRISEQNLIDDVVCGVVEEVQNGKYKNAIKLIDIAKEPEKQEVKLDTSEMIAPVINILPVKGNNEL